MGLKNRMQKLALCALVFAGLSACDVKTSASLTFHVETKDDIKITLDTTDGYSLSQDEGRFKIEKEDEVMMQGIFLTTEGYQTYYDKIQTATEANIHEEGKQSDNPYLFYEVEGEAGREENFLLSIDGSNTHVIIASLLPKDEAIKIFQLLQFEKV